MYVYVDVCMFYFEESECMYVRVEWVCGAAVIIIDFLVRGKMGGEVLKRNVLLFLYISYFFYEGAEHL